MLTKKLQRETVSKAPSFVGAATHDHVNQSGGSCFCLWHFLATAFAFINFDHQKLEDFLEQRSAEDCETFVAFQHLRKLP